MTLPHAPEHGGDVLAVAASRGLEPSTVLDFSNNVLVGAKAITQGLLTGLAPVHDRYPDPAATALRNALARFEEVSPDAILVGAGSSECILTALLALRPKSVRILAPAFSEYARLARGLGAEVRHTTLKPENDFNLDEGAKAELAACDADLLVCCSPNNPSGAVLSGLGDFLSGVPHPALLLDGAYREFLPDASVHAEHGFVRLADRLRSTRLVVLGSFTKFFACPGLRLGWAVAAPELAAAMREVAPPWTTAEHCQIAGVRLLAAHDAYREAWTTEREGKGDFARRLRNTGFFERIHQGELNFVLGKLKLGISAAGLRERLLDRAILVRACGNLVGLGDEYVRLCLRPVPDQKRLCAALGEINPE